MVNNGKFKKNNNDGPFEMILQNMKVHVLYRHAGLYVAKAT